MEDNFNEEIRSKYIKDYNVDIEYMGVEELLQKAKTSPKKNKLIYHRAALEKLTEQEKRNLRATRSSSMDSLLKNFRMTGSMQFVWKAYLLHTNKNIELPVDFQKRLHEEIVKIAQGAVGEGGQDFTEALKKRYTQHTHVLKRAEILRRLIDKGLEVGIHKAYLHVEDECMDPKNPLFDPLMTKERLKGLYRGLYSEQQIRPPKKLD